MSATLNEDFPPCEGQQVDSLRGMVNRLPKLEAKVKSRGVHRKLMQARIDLQGRKLNKSGHNKFAGYYYFELGDFLPVVQEIFANLSLCGVISYGKETASLTITDMEDGSSIDVYSPMSTAALKGCHEVQNLGAVQTYIRRYLWVTAMEIVEHDALDSTTGKTAPDKKETFKTETKSEWDKLDAETQAWMTNEAMAITVMTADGDIEGAYKHLESLELDDTFKTAFWSRLDSTQRSAIKAYSKIIHAKTVDSLATEWAAVPKHSQAALESVKEKRKAELFESQQVAA